MSNKLLCSKACDSENDYYLWQWLYETCTIHKWTQVRHNSIFHLQRLKINAACVLISVTQSNNKFVWDKSYEQDVTLVWLPLAPPYSNISYGNNTSDLCLFDVWPPSQECNYVVQQGLPVLSCLCMHLDLALSYHNRAVFSIYVT